MRMLGMLLALTALLLTLPAAAAQEAETPPPHRLIPVKIDHFAKSPDKFELYVEFGAPFDKNKPTVFFIADGQQFFIRPNSMAAQQARFFGDAFNVVGIMGRGGDYEALRSRVAGADGATDWKEAWRLYRSEQWVEDIETVRRALVGDKGRIMLFGRSGGAYLAHQYIAAHGDKVSRAFTSAPAAIQFSAFAHVTPDHFWEEIAEADPSAHRRIRNLLAREDIDREKLAMTFQRQNFFVNADERDAARLKLLKAFEKGDRDAIEAAYRDYQVDAVSEMNASGAGVPVRVRLFEFAAPFAGVWRVREDRLDPDIEVILQIAAPFMALFEKGEISFEPMDVKRLHERKDTQVFILAGRRDHVVDYRASIALAASYPNATLFLADDTHVFPKMVDAGAFNALLQAFLAYAAGSEELGRVMAETEAFRWREYR